MKLTRFVTLAALALCVSAPAFAQATYPTVSGSRVQGVAPLQCDASGLNCAPITAANPLQVVGSAVPTGTAGSPDAAVLSVQGVAGGTALPASQSGTWNVTNISGTVSLPTGASTEATLSAMSGKLPASLGAKTGATSISVVPNTDTTFATIDTPSGAAASGLAPVATSAVGSNTVVKASAGTLYGFSGNSTVNGFFMLFNATSAPVDGAVTPVKCYPYVANTPFAAGFYPPLFLSTGITVVFSTTGCFTKTASATAFISGDGK